MIQMMEMMRSHHFLILTMLIRRMIFLKPQSVEEIRMIKAKRKMESQKNCKKLMMEMSCILIKRVIFLARCLKP